MAIPISIRSLTKQFPGGATAVDEVSLDIKAGELFFLLGPSGCGKTTLLRMIAGFTEPTSGRLSFADRDVTFLPPNKRNTGMVFQSYALWPHMTVEANVAFGLDVRGVDSAEKRKRVMQALASVRMEEYASRKPTQLSGGQQQRVALARALVIRPDVLLLDEPLSNLDAKLRTDLRGEIRQACKASGITAIYVTHDQKEALSMADRVAIMSRGSVVQLGTPSDLYRRPRTRFVAEFLGETNFLAGVVAEHHNGSTPPTGTVAVDTDAGRLLATTNEQIGVGSKVTCSVRPEAWRIAGTAEQAPNRLVGRLGETTYLGEVAQHLVELTPSTHIKVVELNPALDGLASRGSLVAVATSPQDVIVLVE
ncbi:MAG: ABC transporter ATP-binding protein [Phycisphaeraceae bacterium]|nr:ABC transporter ATP-binding protein [Phycisphaeraceae bacterium]